MSGPKDAGWYPDLIGDVAPVAASLPRLLSAFVAAAAEVVELRAEVDALTKVVGDLALTVTVLRGELAELSESDASD